MENLVLTFERFLDALEATRIAVVTDLSYIRVSKIMLKIAVNGA